MENRRSAAVMSSERSHSLPPASVTFYCGDFLTSFESSVQKETLSRKVFLFPLKTPLKQRILPSVPPMQVYCSMTSLLPSTMHAKSVRFESTLLQREGNVHYSQPDLYHSSSEALSYQTPAPDAEIRDPVRLKSASYYALIAQYGTPPHSARLPRRYLKRANQSDLAVRFQKQHQERSGSAGVRSGAASTCSNESTPSRG